MNVVVVPEVDEGMRRALDIELHAAAVEASGTERYAAAWRLAGFHEGVGHDEPDDVYALLPRSTRGATRA